MSIQRVLIAFAWALALVPVAARGAPEKLTAGAYLDAMHALQTFQDMPEPGREQYREAHLPELEAAAMRLRRAADMYEALLALNGELMSRTGRPVLCNIDMDDDRDPSVDRLIDSYRARLQSRGQSARDAAEQTEHTYIDHLIVTELLSTHPCT